MPPTVLVGDRDRRSVLSARSARGIMVSVFPVGGLNRSGREARQTVFSVFNGGYLPRRSASPGLFPDLPDRIVEPLGLTAGTCQLANLDLFNPFTDHDLWYRRRKPTLLMNGPLYESASTAALIVVSLCRVIALELD